MRVLLHGEQPRCLPNHNILAAGVESVVKHVGDDTRLHKRLHHVIVQEVIEQSLRLAEFLQGFDVIVNRSKRTLQFFGFLACRLIVAVAIHREEIVEFVRLYRAEHVRDVGFFEKMRRLVGEHLTQRVRLLHREHLIHHLVIDEILGDIFGHVRHEIIGDLRRVEDITRVRNFNRLDGLYRVAHVSGGVVCERWR